MGAFEAALEDLGEKVFGGFGPEDALPEPDLLNLEAQLKLRLPTPLRSFYLRVGKNRSLTKAHHRFLTSPTLRNDTLVFMEENQRVVVWGIRREDLSKDDPPVQQGNDAEDVWHPDADFLSAFLLGISCWQAAIGLPWTAQGSVSGELVTQLRTKLTYADAKVDDRQTDLLGYYAKDVVCCVSRSAQRLLAGAKAEVDLERFEKTFALNLDYL
jgi:hypothetical protein